LNPGPEEFPSAAAATISSPLDALLSRVAALRSRIAALTSAMFSSKLRIELRSVGDGVRLKSLTISLDGGVIYNAPARASFERVELVYEHAVAPGPHIVGVEVERHALELPQFSSWQSSRFVVVVPEKKQLWTRLELEDGSDMGQESEAEAAGQYDLRVQLHVEVGE
jgi:hypothetical protein